MSRVIFDEKKAAAAMVRSGAAYNGPQIRVVKPNEQGIIPDRKTSLLKKIADAESELGRLQKLFNEMRADVQHLTVE
jgi:hypothetical protein